MLRIALCEDNTEQMNALRSLLDTYISERPATFHVDAFTDGEALSTAAHAHGYDLYILDILMPGLDGITLARRLRAHDADASIVFLTSSADFALEAFSVSASQYLLKPVERETLFAALDKIVAAHERDEGQFIMLPVKERMLRIPFSSVVCVELAGRALRVCLTDGQTLTSRTVRVPFAAAVAPLLADERFLHAHKSYVLNMAHVRELTLRAFVMENGIEIPVPRNKYTEAKNVYFDYLSSRGIGLLG